MRQRARSLLLGFALLGGCGRAQEGSASGPLEKLDTAEFRDELARLRGVEFRAFDERARRLVEDMLDDLQQNLPLVEDPDLKFDALLREVQTDRGPFVLDGLPGPIPLRLPERLDRLAAAALPALASEQGRDTTLRALRDVVAGAGGITLSRRLAKLPTALDALKGYAAPTRWALGGERPADLHAWARKMQRRPLRKGVERDRRIGDRLAGAAGSWEDGAEPVALCAGRTVREFMGNATVASAVIVALKYRRPERFTGAFGEMIRDTRQGIVAWVADRVGGAWRRAAARLDEYVVQEFDRATSEASGDAGPGPAAPGRSETPADRGRDRDVATPPTPEASRYRGRNFALLVGAADYVHLPKLANPLNDVRALATVLRDRYGFDCEPVLENPTLEELRRRLDECAKRTYAQDDQLLFYFAGHGCVDGRELGQLALTDAGVVADPAASVSMGPGYMRYGELLEDLVHIRTCRHVLVILDACYAGSAFEVAMKSDRGTVASAQDFYARIARTRTCKLITAGGRQSVPDAGRDRRHSPFATRVLELLEGRGEGPSGLIRFSALQAKVEEGTSTAFCGGFGEDQTGSDFVFVAGK
jgi:hypothetical protein